MVPHESRAGRFFLLSGLIAGACAVVVVIAVSGCEQTPEKDPTEISSAGAGREPLRSDTTEDDTRGDEPARDITAEDSAGTDAPGRHDTVEGNRGGDGVEAAETAAKPPLHEPANHETMELSTPDPARAEAQKQDAIHIPSDIERSEEARPGQSPGETDPSEAQQAEAGNEGASDQTTAQSTEVTPERSADGERSPQNEQDKLGPADIKAALSEIEEKMKGTQTTQADFVQEKKMTILKKPLVIRGRLCLQKPDRFAWLATSPMGYSIVLKGGRIYTWDEDTDAVQKNSLKGNPGMRVAIDHITQWFSGKYSSLQNGYDIRLVKKAPITLEFAPREDTPARDFIRTVRIAFDSESGYLESMFMVENNGNSSLMTFSNVKINAKLPPRAWEPRQNAR